MGDSKRIRVLGLALYGPQAASHRVRLSQYTTGLKANGIDLDIHSLLDDPYVISKQTAGGFPILSVLKSSFARLSTFRKKRNYDLALVNCEFFPFLPSAFERVLLGLPYIYDFDDAWFLRYQTGRFKVFRNILGDKFEDFIARARFVTAGNKFLVEYAQRFNPAVVHFPSVTDTSICRPGLRTYSNEFRVGWVGSHSTTKYLSIITDSLSRLGARTPVTLITVGASKLDPIPNVRLVQREWSARDEIHAINNFDVGVMPLGFDDWCRGKCGYKLIQYMGCGVPVIASAVGANMDIVSRDVGFLARQGQEWDRAFMALFSDPALRAEMGSNARRRAESNYSLTVNMPVLVELIKNVGMR